MDRDFNRGADREIPWERNEDWEGEQHSDRGIGRDVHREAADTYGESHSSEPHDLTLGMTALLGIFLAVVLVCAVFFGFGYSTGRTLHGAKATGAPVASTNATPTGSTAVTDDDPAGAAVSASGSAFGSAFGSASASARASAAPQLAVAPPAAKPSAGAPMAGATVEDRAVSAPPAKTAGESAGELAAATHRLDVPAIASIAPAGSSAAGTEGVMVQIAAVAHQADADMLARALRGNGYAAVVRTEPQDSFLHVQVGPFATRDQAKTMRARLQAAGYNAFLKP